MLCGLYPFLSQIPTEFLKTGVDSIPQFPAISARVPDLGIFCVLFLLLFSWGLNEAFWVITAASFHLFFIPYPSFIPFLTLISWTLVILSFSCFRAVFVLPQCKHRTLCHMYCFLAHLR